MTDPRNPGRLSSGSARWPTSWDTRMEAVLVTLIYLLNAALVLTLLGVLAVFVWRAGWPAFASLAVLSAAFCATYRFVVRRSA